MIEGHQAAEAAIKAMYCHILALLAMGPINLLFVFDAANRHAKDGRKFNGQGVSMLHKRNGVFLKTLDALAIPYYEAPGEAEAECAMLQMKGHVDAVWSEDSDTLMFGCSLMLRYHRITDQNPQKQKQTVRTIRSGDIGDFDRAGLTLFAMVVGGDYNKTGLKGCGSVFAKHLIREGFHHRLVECRNQMDCDNWREALKQALPQIPDGENTEVPDGYPSYDILKLYMYPKVSEDDELNKLSFIRNRPAHKFDEKKLYFQITTSHFNQWGRLYMKNVTPILLTRWLLAASGTRGVDNPHQVQLVKTRPKAGSANVESSYVEVKFSPFGLTTLPPDVYKKQWQKVDPKKRKFKEQIYHPEFTVRFDYAPRALIQKVLPQLFGANPKAVRTPKSSKRKTSDDLEEVRQRSTKSKKTYAADSFTRKGNGSHSKDNQLSAMTFDSAIRKSSGNSTKTNQLSAKKETGSPFRALRVTPKVTPSKTNGSTPGTLELMTLSDTDDDEELEKENDSSFTPRSQALPSAFMQSRPPVKARPDTKLNVTRSEVIDLTED